MNEEFNPQKLVDLAESMVDENIEDMSHQLMVDVIRDVVDAFYKHGLIEMDPEDPTGSIHAAMQVLYVCKLIPKIFPTAYNLAAIEVDMARDKDAVVDALKRSFEL